MPAVLAGVVLMLAAPDTRAGLVVLVLADAVLEKFGGDSLGETRRNVQAYLENVRYR